MNRRSDEHKDSNLTRTGGDPNPDLIEWVWMVRGGIARAQVQADGTIKGVRFSDDGDGSLVEVWIKRPTK
jgi:hypothetical protein